MGFAVPLESWLYQEYTNEVQQVLLDPHAHIYEYLNPIWVKALFDCPPIERGVNSIRLWTLLVLETWFQKVLC